jgi:hypothetical protein
MLYHISNYLFFGPGPLTVGTIKTTTGAVRDSSVNIVTRYGLDGPGFSVNIVTRCRLDGPGFSVNIVIRYGLDGPGVESRWRRDFPHPSKPALGPTQPPIHSVPGLCREESGRGLGLAINHPPISSAEEGKSRDIPLLPFWSFMACRDIPLLPFWSFMACSRVKFTFYLYIHRIIFRPFFFNEHLLRHVIYILVQRANYWQFVSSLVEVV